MRSAPWRKGDSGWSCTRLGVTVAGCVAKFFGMSSVELCRHVGEEAEARLWRLWRERGWPGEDSARDGVFLVASNLEVNVFLWSCSDKTYRSSSSTSGGASASVPRWSVFCFVVNKDRCPLQFQFLDKVVCRPRLCNDRFRCLWAAERQPSGKNFQHFYVVQVQFLGVEGWRQFAVCSASRLFGLSRSFTCNIVSEEGARQT